MTEAPQTVRIFLLDDHEVVRQGIAELLEDIEGFQVVGEAGTAGEAVPRILAARPDVAVLDMRLPDGSGIDVCREVRAALPQTHCLILTSYDDQDAVLASVMAGASGYVRKEVRAAALVDAIRQAAMGRSLIDPALIMKVVQSAQQGPRADDELAALTEREREVLALVAEGLTNRQIGERMFLSDKTVKNYVSSLLSKLGMQRRTQAAVFATELRKDD